MLTSATTGLGIDRLRQQLRGRATVFSGQSGVGKSSLLNAVQPGLGLAVKTVSEVNNKGRHTTTYAQLIKLAIRRAGWSTRPACGNSLWDVRPEEVEGYFPEFRPFVPLCGFPGLHPHARDRLRGEGGGGPPADQRRGATTATWGCSGGRSRRQATGDRQETGTGDSKTQIAGPFGLSPRLLPPSPVARVVRIVRGARNGR